MRIGAIIQARMSSKRLPGKVLMQILYKPILLYLLERIGKCSRLDTIIVATSDDDSDDPIEEFCDDFAVECYRGSLENVAERFRDAAKTYKLDAFVRVCSDSPLLDPGLVDEHVELFRQGDSDLVTNVKNRTFPPGQSVEVISAEVFVGAVKKMDKPQHFEHVTRYFYENSADFVIKEIKCPVKWGDTSFAVDNLADFERIEALIAAMDRSHLDYTLSDLIHLDGQLQVLAGRDLSA